MLNRQTCISGLALICSQLAWPQTGVISTYAGNGTSSYSGDGGAASSAGLSHPFGLALDASGNLYIADMGNARVRRVAASNGIITTVAGSGIPGYSGDGGFATAAQLFAPTDVKLDSGGNLYVCDSSNNRVRRVDAVTGIISTAAGTGVAGFGGDGGAATNAALNAPSGLAIDSTGNIYVADTSNNRIRRIDASTGVITTVAGNGVAAFAGDGGPATAASMSSPVAMALDSAGNLYVSDAGILFAATSGSGGGPPPPVQNYRVRRIDAVTGIISTVAGTGVSSFNGDGIPATGANLGFPVQLVFDLSGNLVFTDTTNYRVRMADASTGLIWTMAGTGSAPGCCFNGDGGPATNAPLSLPVGLAISPSGPLFASEYGGNRVRRVALPSPFASTATTLSANPASVQSGDPVTFTAVLSAVNGLAGNATRGFQFVDLTTGALLGQALIANGSGSFTKTFSGIGTHSVVANYVGDSTFGGSSSSALSLNITAPQSSVTLVSNSNPSIDGQPFTLTASVNPAAATGTVTFFNGTAQLGTQSVSNGTAVSPQISLSAGTYFLSAQYGGDINHPSSTSPTITQTVNVASSSVSLTSSANPATAGQALTLTATVSPSTATGSVTFLDGGLAIGTSTVVSGAAVFSTSALTPGTHSFIAAYSGDSHIFGSTSLPVAEVVKATSSLTLAASANPSISGQLVTFTVAVTPLTATGSVQFLDGGLVIGTTSVGSPTAFSTSALTPGTHSITAVYGGDSNTFGSTSTAVAEVIKTNSSLTLTASTNPSTLGQAVTFTVAITPLTATGNVQFLDGGVAIGTGTIGSGTAIFSTSALTSGTHSITATYGGDSNTAGSTSPAVSEVVKSTSSLTLSASDNPATLGQMVTFSVAITPSTATGSVQFLDGGVAIGNSALGSGVATFSTSALTSGTHSITASYGGDSNTAGSTSPAVAEVIKATSSLTLTASANPATMGQTVNFTVALTPSTATGTVQFLDSGTVIGTSTVSSGAATFSTSVLTQGTHSITATYSGDSSTAASSSLAIAEVIKAPSSLTLAASANPSTVGQTVILTVAVTPSTATGNVQFLDGGVVIGTSAIGSGSASFSTSALTQGIHSITAAYGGDSSLNASTSVAISQSVLNVTSVTLASNSNPSTTGQPVTFTVNLNPAATGSVQFLDGAVMIGTGSVASGVATFSTPALALGTHTITAAYGGDTNFASASSAPLAQTVVKATATVSLASTQNPSPVGQPVTFIANITPSAATGSVQFLDGSTAIGTAAITPGSGAQFSTSGLTQGTHSITAVYGGDATFAPATSPAVSQSVKLIGGLAFTASPNPSTVGQTVTFTVSMNPAATGSVQYFDGASLIGTAPVVSGVSTFSTSALALGTHAISVVYGGDANYLSAGSAPLNQTVNAKQTPSVSLGSSANPAASGQAVTFTASISPATATGSVQFLDGGTVIGTASVGSGIAIFSTNALARGIHSISAVYGGDSFFVGAASAAIAQSVKGAAGLTLASSVNPSSAGQAVTFTATVNPAATGSVQYLDGSALIGTASVVSGVATLSTGALAVGSHSISVVYGGDANFFSATSAPLTQNVVKATSSVVLASSLNPSIAGQAVTFSVTVAPASATGTVQIFDGGTSLGTATLNKGTGSFTTSSLAAGAHSIKAVYGGDSATNGSTSSIVTQTVKTATTTTLTSSENPEYHTNTIVFTAKVAPKAATGSVQFFDGTTLIGTATLNNGSASLSKKLSAGTHPIHAVYGGDVTYGGSSSAILTETVH